MKKRRRLGADADFTDLGNRGKRFSMQKYKRGDTPALCVLIVNQGGGFHARIFDSVYETLSRLRLRFSVMFIDARLEEDPVGMIKDYPDIRYIVPGKETSYPHAVNLGVKESGAPFVLAMDTETVLEGFDAHAVFSAMEDPRIFALCPFRHDEDGALILNRGNGYISGDTIIVEYEAPLAHSLSINIREGFALYRTDTFLYLNGFDGGYYRIESESLDLSYRAYANGFYLMMHDGIQMKRYAHKKVHSVLRPSVAERQEHHDELYFHFRNVLMPKYTMPGWKLFFLVLLSIFFPPNLRLYYPLFKKRKRISEQRYKRMSEVSTPDEEIVLLVRANTIPPLRTQ